MLEPKRLSGPVLSKLKLPCGILIAFLFALQLIVFCVVQTGQDIGGGAVIVQAVIFLICFVALLAFYLYATVRLFVAISKSPQLMGRRLLGPMLLAATSILSCFFAFAAAGIVLAESTYVASTFVLLEVLSDLSTLSACLGIALVIKASPPKSKLRLRGETISRLGERLRSFSVSRSERSKSREAMSPRSAAASDSGGAAQLPPRGTTWESSTIVL